MAQGIGYAVQDAFLENVKPVIMHEVLAGRRYAVIMPARNEERFVRRTLDCLARQTAPPSVCILVDDGSSDRTAAIAEEAMQEYAWLQVVRRPDRGMRGRRSHRSVLFGV